MKNIKIYVPDHKKDEFNEKCIAMGIHSAKFLTSIANFFYLSNNIFTHSIEDFQFFKNHKYEEITIDDFFWNQYKG
jgi:hypothetical protein